MNKVTSIKQFIDLLYDSMVELYIVIEGKEYELNRVRAFDMTLLHIIELINDQHLLFK